MQYGCHLAFLFPPLQDIMVAILYLCSKKFMTPCENVNERLKNHTNMKAENKTRQKL